MKELAATGFMSNRGRQVHLQFIHDVLENFHPSSKLENTLEVIKKDRYLLHSNYSSCFLWVNQERNCHFKNILLSFARLCVLFLFEIWASTGGWELNGLRHASWIMILAPTMETGHMEQVILLLLSSFDISTFSELEVGIVS